MGAILTDLTPPPLILGGKQERDGGERVWMSGRVRRQAVYPAGPLNSAVRGERSIDASPGAEECRRHTKTRSRRRDSKEAPLHWPLSAPIIEVEVVFFLLLNNVIKSLSAVSWSDNALFFYHLGAEMCLNLQISGSGQLILLRNHLSSTPRCCA